MRKQYLVALIAVVVFFLAAACSQRGYVGPEDTLRPEDSTCYGVVVSIEVVGATSSNIVYEVKTDQDMVIGMVDSDLRGKPVIGYKLYYRDYDYYFVPGDEDFSGDW